MKPPKSQMPKQDPLWKGEQLNIISTVGLIILMFFFLVLTITSSSKLAKQTNIISNHPFEVVISAGDVKLAVSEMQIHTDQLLIYNEENDLEQAKSALEELQASLAEPVAQMKTLYLGEKEDLDALEETLHNLLQEQNHFLNYISEQNKTGKNLQKFQHKHLQSLYSQVLELTEKIITIAKEKKVGYGETANSLRRNTLVGSIILMILMVGSLLISQFLLHRQRKELVYRSLLFDNLSMSIDDTFLIRDARTGAISYCSLNMERVLGTSITRKASGEIYQGLKSEDVAEIYKAVKALDFPSPYEKVVEYRKPDGEKRWLSIRIYRTENLDTPQLITVYSDRTEEILSRQVLQDAMLNAERANLAKSDFLSRMSHEIRTPLNAIIGMTTIAAAVVKDTARVEDCLAKINFSSKHLLMLINDVLDMSKIESNKMVIQNEPFDIFQVINGYVSTVYAQAKAKQIEFIEHMEGFGECTTFIGDSLRLNQILLNLSSNAVKFTAPGGKITLTVSRLAARNTVDILRFILADTGIGMTKEAVERIYQPFEQADASVARNYGGTGLGMSITKNLVTLMNGKIRVESEPGVGTTCIVDLPFQRGAENIKEPDFENEGLCALIVDDEQQVCEQTSCLLEKIKIRAEWTMSGVRAIERVLETHRNNQDFDLCLIDWKMPDMDGIEVTRRIRREVDAEIPIVMISAYDITEVEQEAREAGVNGFLPKPLYRSSVYEAVKEALEGKHKIFSTERKERWKHPLEGKCLLLAEDNKLNQEIAEELLKMSGAEVKCVDDGKQALELFVVSEPGDYDAILLDVQMPVMNGYEAAKSIRISDHPLAKTIPIIATTANAFSDDISAALAAGMNAHVSKPLDIQQLCAVLEECFQKARQKEENF